jgi:hypothetical protein
MENMISPTVMTKYCGISHNMCSEFSFVKMYELSLGADPMKCHQGIYRSWGSGHYIRLKSKRSRSQSYDFELQRHD